MTVAMPVQSGAQLFFTTFYDGPLMLTRTAHEIYDMQRAGANVEAIYDELKK